MCLSIPSIYLYHIVCNDGKTETTHYCKFGNFRENLFSRIAVKTHIFDVEIRDKGLIYLVNGSDFFRIREDFIFTKLRSFAKIKPSRKLPNL